ncbi:MAG TPA: galactokinase [Terriglobales bacterium]|nr:galactokinase [Terriglobales bacterium]
MNATELAERFQERFHSYPQVFSAPGRVNLIGEHTDYNDGFVLPSAIGFFTRAAIAPRNDNKLVIRSTEFEESFEGDIKALPANKLGAWYDYILGVAAELVRAGVRPAGASVLIHGEVPIGAGLSSSAALEVASAFALLSLTHAELPPKTIAKLCQRAENEFIGARVGIMDQFVSCLGQEGFAVLLDCRSLEFELVPLPETIKFVICNTMVKHEHSGGEYNQRRRECEQGVEILSRFYPGISALRDVSLEQLRAHSSDMPAIIYKRCLHVVEENDRVLKTGRLFRSGDLAGVGQLMRESHVSMRDLYEISCRELDIMVESAEGLPGYYGGRMTGGGFGGCTVNLVAANKSEAFRDKIAQRYKQQTGISAEIYICSPASGAHAELKTASV